GISYMRYSVSDTAEYGDYIAGDKVINEQSRAAMKKLLADIQDGTFAEAWIEENRAGQPNFKKKRTEEMDHQIERVGLELRRMMPFVNPREVKPGEGGA